MIPSSAARLARLAAAVAVVGTLAGCPGVGLYGEVNAGYMTAELARQREPALGAALPTDSGAPTVGFALGVDFDYAYISYLGLGYLSQHALLTADDAWVGLSDVEVLAMSTIPRFTRRRGGGVLTPRAAVGVAWNNDDRRTYAGFFGLGATLHAGRRASYTGLVGPTLTRWEMGGGGRYEAIGVLARVRYTHLFGRKERSR